MFSVLKNLGWQLHLCCKSVEEDGYLIWHLATHSWHASVKTGKPQLIKALTHLPVGTPTNKPNLANSTQGPKK